MRRKEGGKVGNRDQSTVWKLVVTESEERRVESPRKVSTAEKKN